MSMQEQAHGAVHRAIKEGTLVRPGLCSRCGCDGAIEAHHHDYAKPLEVEWLCRKCHRTEHTKLRQRKSQETASWPLKDATVEDVAKYFGVTTRTVRRWLKDTSIPHTRPGGSIRFNLEDVHAWAEDVADD